MLRNLQFNASLILITLKKTINEFLKRSLVFVEPYASFIK